MGSTLATCPSYQRWLKARSSVNVDLDVNLDVNVERETWQAKARSPEPGAPSQARSKGRNPESCRIPFANFVCSSPHREVLAAGSPCKATCETIRMEKRRRKRHLHYETELAFGDCAPLLCSTSRHIIVTKDSSGHWLRQQVDWVEYPIPVVFISSLHSLRRFRICQHFKIMDFKHLHKVIPLLFFTIIACIYVYLPAAAVDQN